MAVIDKEIDGHKEIVYESPHELILERKSNALISQFIKYAKAAKLSPEEICIQRADIPRIVLRVDKREGYFAVFHKRMKINEIKQAALTAYWVLKFKPFMISTEDPKRSHKYARINEGFAVFYILSACKQSAEENGYVTRDFSESLHHELMYAFTYWDLSKESMIMMAETIGESFFGIPAEGIPDHGSN